jgi:Tol biopolymer transport system component
MAPELFEGKEADARSDVFGFGCVLYEMVTGKRAFGGKTRVSVVASIIGSEPPPMSALQPLTPAALERLALGCLVKDPDERYQSLWDVLMDLRSIAGARAEERARSLVKRAWLPWAVAGLFMAAAAAAIFLWLRQPAPEMRASAFTLDPPPDNQFTNAYGATAVSPDGRYLVFAAAAGSAKPSLWLRPIDSLSVRVLPGTESGNFPFWSPESKSIAFFATDGKLKRVDIAGGAPLVLCDATLAFGDGLAAAGGAWSREGVILFGSVSGLQRVAASGGVPALLTKADASRQEFAHGFPQFLPDGKRFLYFIRSRDSNVAGIYAGSLDRPQERLKILRASAKAVYAPPVSGRPGYLLWLREQTLMTQRFDAGNLRLEGDPRPLVEDVAMLGSRAAFWVSDAGLLVYRTGEDYPRHKMTWMSRDGKRLEEAGQEDRYNDLRLSPDGRRVAIGRRDAANENNWDVWLFDFGRTVMTRVTFDPKEDNRALWSPDGRQIAFASDRSGVAQLYRKDAGGGGREEQLTEGPNPKYPTDWSRDGRYLLYSELGQKTGEDLWALPLEAAGASPVPGVRKPILVLQTPYSERGAVFSPDGKWIAYTSDESGLDAVYVMAFPEAPSGPASKWQVSNQGGSRPKWPGDGKELFYVGPGGGSIMAAGIRTSAAGIESGTPRLLFAMSQLPPSVSPYDVTADGQRFLVLQPPGGTRGVASLTVVTNWQSVLKQ